MSSFKSKNRKNSFVILASFLAFAGIFGIAGSQLFSQQRANAAPTPESCFTFNSGTNTITGYKAADPSCPSDVEIPANIGGVDVLEIGEGAFRNKGITGVTFANGITAIDGNAFRQNNIASVSFPDSVVSIGSAAFYGNDLTSLDLPSNMTTIADSAFEQNDLTDLTIPEGVTTILWNAFGSNQLTNINFPSTLLSISAGSFANNQLESIDLPENLQSMTGGSFYNNKLTSVTLPASLTQLWDPATPWYGPDVFANNYITTVYVEGDVAIPSDTFINNVANTGQYIQLYTADESNPHGYADLAGTYVVNPAQLYTNYTDKNGAALASQKYEVGEDLSDYTVAANPTADFGKYWRTGDTVVSQPVDVSGYVTPASQSGAVRAGANTRTFVYTPIGGDVEPTDPIVPTTPNTGRK